MIEAATGRGELAADGYRTPPLSSAAAALLIIEVSDTAR
jgi:hypothetical protein